MRKWARALAGGVVAAALLGGVELVLRGLLGPPPPAVRVFAGLQVPERWLLTEGDRVRAAGEGMADELGEVGFSCAGSGPRMLFLGGSSVHGGTPDLDAAEEFPALVGEARGVETLALAQPGLDSHALVELMEAFGDCRAEVVVVYMGHNDLGNVRFYDRYGSLGQGLTVRFQAALGELQLYAQLRRAVGGVSGAQRGRGAGAEHIPAPLEVVRVDAALTAFEANVARMRWLTAAQGRTLVLVPPLSDLLSEPVDQVDEADLRNPQPLAPGRGQRPEPQPDRRACVGVGQVIS